MNNMKEDTVLKEKIKSESALYFYRATPFTQHGEFNYDGELTEEFFFKNLFSAYGNCNKYIAEIKTSLKNNRHKSILLIGNQGCGKTTFVHHLQRECSDFEFLFFDFDENTSNPTITEYIERLSTHLLGLLKSDSEVNKAFYNLYIKNRALINKKLTGVTMSTISSMISKKHLLMRGAAYQRMILSK